MRVQTWGGRSLHALALCGCSLLYLDCASTEATFYDKERLTQIKSWEIVYSSEVAGDEPTHWAQDRTVSAGRNRTPQSSLHLADGIFFRLKERFNVRMIRETGLAEGQIRLHAVNFINGGCKVLNVSIYDQNNQLLARTRIYPDFRKTNFSYADSFPEDAATTIVDLLRPESK